jgi:ubiquinone/menaquinone biosynthesis C-methylase UbiE
MIDPFKFLEESGIRSGMKVADFGCGTLGHYVFPASQMVGPQGKIYAVDILKSVLDGITGRIKMDGAGNVESIWGDIERPNGVRLPDASLDLVILANNLFLSKQKPAMFKECARVLKRGGRLAIAEWKPTGVTIGPSRESVVPPEEAKSLADQAGLLLEREFNPGKYHYGLSFIKS